MSPPPPPPETAEVDFMVTFSSCVIGFWNAELEIERYMWLSDTCDCNCHVMPFIFKFNSHQQPSLSNIDVTIRVHYNCQMWESLVIVQFRPIKRTSDLKQGYKIVKYNFDQPWPSALQHDLQIANAKWKTARASTHNNHNVNVSEIKRAPYFAFLFLRAAPMFTRLI